jgi:hypothetical protein
MGESLCAYLTAGSDVVAAAAAAAGPGAIDCGAQASPGGWSVYSTKPMLRPHAPWGGAAAATGQGEGDGEADAGAAASPALRDQRARSHGGEAAPSPAAPLATPPRRQPAMHGGSAAAAASAAKQRPPELHRQILEVSARLKVFASDWVQRLEAVEVRAGPPHACEAPAGGSGGGPLQQQAKQQQQQQQQQAPASQSADCDADGADEESDDVTQFKGSPVLQVRTRADGADERLRSSGGSAVSGGGASAASAGVSNHSQGPPSEAAAAAPPAAASPAGAGHLRDDGCPTPLAAGVGGSPVWGHLADDTPGSGRGGQQPTAGYFTDGDLQGLADDPADAPLPRCWYGGAPDPLPTSSPVRPSAEGPLAAARVALAAKRAVARARRGGADDGPLRASASGLPTVRSSCNGGQMFGAAQQQPQQPQQQPQSAREREEQAAAGAAQTLTSPLMQGRQSLSSLQRSTEFKRSA